jgi:hypothetical protein
MIHKLVIAICGAVLLAVAGTTTLDARQGQSGPVNDPDSSSSLSGDEVDGLMFMREEEKLARDTYIILGEEWGLLVFENISDSEQQHMDAVRKLLNKYDLADPVEDESTLGGFKNEQLQTMFETLVADGLQSTMDGLYVGALIEETDMRDIQYWMNLADHSSIINTYDTLMCGSRNHLRAFVRQIEIRGGEYSPNILPDEVFAAIVDSPTERDCGNKRKR